MMVLNGLVKHIEDGSLSSKIKCKQRILWPYKKIREYYHRVYRICYWLPTLWRSHWWDHVFLLEMLERKLQYDAKRYRKYGIACGADKRARQMQMAAFLCKRIREDDYKTPWDKEAEEHIQQFMQHMTKTREKIGNQIWCTSKGFAPEKRLEDCNRFAGDRKRYLKEQDLAYLCQILNKHLLSWWD